MAVSITRSYPERAHKYIREAQCITPTGVDPGFAIDEQSVRYLATYLGTIQDVSLWLLADLLVWCETQAARETGQTSGREYWNKRNIYWDQLLKACKLDLAPSTVYNIAATGRAWAWERRRHTEVVSFEHHRLLVSLPHEEQEQWLDMVEAGEWSVARLRHHLYNKEIDPLANMSLPAPKRALWDDTRIEGAVRTLTNGEGLNEVSVTKLLRFVRDEYEERGKYHE